MCLITVPQINTNNHYVIAIYILCIINEHTGSIQDKHFMQKTNKQKTNKQKH